MQKVVTNAVGVSNYSKMEKGERDVSIEVAGRLAKYFGIALDELVHLTEQIPNEVSIVDKSVSKSVNLIQQLDDEDKQALFRIILTVYSQNQSSRISSPRIWLRFKV